MRGLPPIAQRHVSSHRSPRRASPVAAAHALVEVAAVAVVAAVAAVVVAAAAAADLVAVAVLGSPPCRAAACAAAFY